MLGMSNVDPPPTVPAEEDDLDEQECRTRQIRLPAPPLHEKNLPSMHSRSRGFFYIDVLVACWPTVEKVAENLGLFAALWGATITLASALCAHFKRRSCPHLVAW
jgi:hypothetical protein